MYGTYTGTSSDPTAARSIIVDTTQACPPSPISANHRPPTRMHAGGTNTAATPGGEWTVVTGKPPASAKPKSTALSELRAHDADGRPAGHIDKGKARGPPGPPSPPQPAYRQAPPVSKVPEGPVDWRTAPRDFYHLGTDLAALKRPPPADAPPVAASHTHARPDTRDDARREVFGVRETKRPRRHSPVREEDPFVPSSKDLERMNSYGSEIPLWAATPDGGHSVRNAKHAHELCLIRNV